MLDAGCWVFDVGRLKLVCKIKSNEVAESIADAGCWVFDVGRLKLVCKIKSNEVAESIA